MFLVEERLSKNYKTVFCIVREDGTALRCFSSKKLATTVSKTISVFSQRSVQLAALAVLSAVLLLLFYGLLKKGRKAAGRLLGPVREVKRTLEGFKEDLKSGKSPEELASRFDSVIEEVDGLKKKYGSFYELLDHPSPPGEELLAIRVLILSYLSSKDSLKNLALEISSAVDSIRSIEDKRLLGQLCEEDVMERHRLLKRVGWLRRKMCNGRTSLDRITTILQKQEAAC